MDLKSVLLQRNKIRYGHSDKITITLVTNETTFEFTRFNEMDQISKYPNARSIAIAGLRQDDFERFISDFAHQFEIIHFWKCPYVSDLSSLGTLRSVKYITYFWNQRSERLWDMVGNNSLMGLEFECFTRMHILNDIISALYLKELCLSRGIALGNYSIKTLRPLINCKSIETLSFDTFIDDHDPLPLLKIPTLKNLFFPCNMFTTEEIANLTAKLPDVRCNAFAPYIAYDNMCGKSVAVVGKRKPWLDPEKDASRIEMYKKQFETLVEKYKNDADRES
jgi:hypothetical protein